MKITKILEIRADVFHVYIERTLAFLKFWPAIAQRVKFPVRLFVANQIAKKIQNYTVPDVPASLSMERLANVCLSPDPF